MGYILTATAVDLGQVSGAFGSRNEWLVRDLVETFGREFAQFDEMAADFAEDNELAEAVTIEAALTQIVMGEAYNEKLGFMYGYVLEFLCRYFGDWLPNECWSGMPSPSDWARTVDRGLENAGVAASMLRVENHLMNRGPPIAIPQIDDFPGIGYLKLDEVKAAQKSLAQANLAAIKNNEVLEAIQDVQSWLRICADSGRDLICFYA